MKINKNMRLELLKSLKLVIIFLAILNLMFPLIFAWIVEISMDFNPNILLTNGFDDREPMQIYHLALYGMIISSIVTSLFVFYSLDKFIFGGKNGE